MNATLKGSTPEHTLRVRPSIGNGHLRSLPTETAGECEVLGLNGNTFGVDGSQVGVLEQRDEVRLGGFLKGHHSGRLEPQVGLEILSDLTNEPLEGKLPDKQLSGLLVTPDFTESDGSRAEPVGLLDTTSGSLCCLPSGLCCELLARGFASGGLAGCLLGTGHW